MSHQKTQRGKSCFRVEYLPNGKCYKNSFLKIQADAVKIAVIFLHRLSEIFLMNLYSKTTHLFYAR